jgi:hypothetical protein
LTRQYVERNFSVRVMAEKYMKIYKRVIAAAKGETERKFPTRTLDKITLDKTLLTPRSSVIKKVVPAQVGQAVQVAAEAKKKN